MSPYTADSTASSVATALASHIVGKVVLITGCSANGLGATAAFAIAHHNPGLLVLTGRNRFAIEETEKAIRAQSPTVNTRLLIFDLASLASVRAAALEVSTYPEQIDVLINNAGIMAPPFSKTIDGFESQFGVNHLGPFLFTNLLIAGGRLAKGARVVNVSSAAYAFGGIRFEDVGFEVSV